MRRMQRNNEARKAPRRSFNIAAACATELSGCDYSAEVETRRPAAKGDNTHAIRYNIPISLMVAGAVLVVLGFIGFALRQNRNGQPRPPKAEGEVGRLADIATPAPCAR